MPTVLTPQGWVKVAPAPKRKQAAHNPKNFLRGPLAYLACQPQTPTINIGGGGGVRGKAPFPYDLSASPEKLQRQSQAHIQTASRTVSAPVMHGALYQSDDDDQLSEPQIEMPRPPRSEVHSRSRPKSRVSRHHNDDNHSVASSGSSSSSHSDLPSSRSYNRHRPVEARPPPQPLPPNNHYYSAPRYDHYSAHPPPPQMPVHMSMQMPLPLPPSSGRSLSYSWYNATTPLNLN